MEKDQPIFSALVVEVFLFLWNRLMDGYMGKGSRSENLFSHLKSSVADTGYTLSIETHWGKRKPGGIGKDIESGKCVIAVSLFKA